MTEQDVPKPEAAGRGGRRRASPHCADDPAGADGERGCRDHSSNRDRCVLDVVLTTIQAEAKSCKEPRSLPSVFMVELRAATAWNLATIGTEVER